MPSREGDTSIGLKCAPNESEGFTRHSFEILVYIRDIQNMHGASQNDYKRYILFTTRKVRKLLPKGKVGGRFKYKGMKFECDAMGKRDLKLLILMTERDLYKGIMLSMSEKSNASINCRKSRRLRKAMIYAKLIMEYGAKNADYRTRLESLIYFYWVCGIGKFKCQQLDQGMQFLNRAYRSLSDLIGIVPMSQRSIYVQFSEEVGTVLKFVTSNGTNLPIDVLLEASQNPNLKIIDSYIDDTIKDYFQGNSSFETSSIYWKRPIELFNDKIRICYAKCRQYSMATHVEFSEDFEKNYDRLLMCIYEAQKLVEAERKSTTVEGKGDDLRLLGEFFRHYQIETLLKFNDRNIELLEGIFESLGLERLGEFEVDKLVRYYGTQLQLIAEKNQLDSYENFMASEFAFRALKCYYLGIHNAKIAKWHESLALMNKANGYAQAGELLFKALKFPDKHLVDRVDRLMLQVQSSRMWIHAKAYEELVLDARVDYGLCNAEASRRTLLHDLDSWDAGYLDKKRLVNFPPFPEPIPNRPVIFDLAISCYIPPSLSEKIKSLKSSGLFGFLGL